MKEEKNMDDRNAQAPRKEHRMLVSSWLCLACGSCVRVCPTGAVRVTDVAEIDPEKCICCGGCAGRCPTGAIEYV